jgi:membrane protein implicated in regulation of membrane protease activity
MWNAVSDDTIQKGEKVTVEQVNGLTLKVKRTAQ